MRLTFALIPILATLTLAHCDSTSLPAAPVSLDASLDALANSDSPNTQDAVAVDAGTEVESGAQDAAVFSLKTACSVPIKVSDNGATSLALSPSLTFTPSGRALLAYYDAILNTTNRIVRVRAFDGTTWSNSIATLANTNDTPRPSNVALDPGGDALLTYNVPGDELTRYRFAGNTWQTTSNVSGINATESSAMAFLSNSRPLHVYFGVGAPDYAIHDGSNWSGPTTLRASAPGTTTMRVLRTTNGAAVVWADLDQDINARFFSSTSIQGGLGLIDAANAVGTLDYLAVAAQPNNQVLVAWYKRTAGPVRELMLTTLSTNGVDTTFAPPVAIATGEEFVAPQMVADATGDITVTWTLSSGTKALRRISGTWSAVVDLGKTSSEVAHLAIDASGHVTALIRDNDSKVYHRRVAHGTNAWTAPHRIDTAAFPGSSERAAIALTASGDPLVVWGVSGGGKWELVASICQ